MAINHVMIDIETLSTDPGGLILSIGAVKFNDEGFHEKFYTNVDALSSLLAGFTVNPRTIKWWNDQDLPALTRLEDPSDCHIVKDCLNKLSNFIARDDLVWAKGPDFDLVMLKAAYDRLKIKVPWSFRNTRDVRTILWLAKFRNVKVLEKPPWMISHYALHDAIHQANQVVAVCESLGIKL